MTSRRTIPRRTAFDLLSVLSEYLQNRSIKERSDYHESDGKKKLMMHLETDGEIQEGGHRTLEVDPPLSYMQYKGGKPIEKRVTGIKRTRRQSTSLNEDRTMALLKELNLVDACTEIIVVLNEDAVLAANYEGKISDEALEACYDESETFAFNLETEDA